MRIEVKVYPQSSQEAVREGDVWKVYLRQSATNGKANEALRKIIGKHFGVAKSFVTILQGEKSRNKLIEIKK